MYSVWGEQLETVDVTTGKRVFQPFKFYKNYVVKACRLKVVCYNDPTFTSLYAEIYSYSNNAPVKLLHTSTNVITKASMMSEDNGLYEIYFEFNEPVFRANDSYALILRANGYTYMDASHIAWAKAFPDPVNKNNNVVNGMEDIATVSYDTYFIGAKL